MTPPNAPATHPVTARPPAGQPLAALNAAAEQLWLRLNAILEAHQSGDDPAGRQRNGISIEVLASIDSTNTELMRRARAGQCDPVLLLATEQTAGRGRMGKTWLSEPGACLMFSLGLPMQPAHWAGLSLAVGVSLADTLASTLPAAIAPRLQLKWPNDLWLCGAKLAGILVETAHVGTRPYVVVGVGINITPPPPEAPSPRSDAPPSTLAKASPAMRKQITSASHSMVISCLAAAGRAVPTAGVTVAAAVGRRSKVTRVRTSQAPASTGAGREMAATRARHGGGAPDDPAVPPLRFVPCSSSESS